MLVTKSPIKGNCMIINGKDYYIVLDERNHKLPIPVEVSDYLSRLIKSNKITWKKRKVEMDELVEMEKLKLLSKDNEIKTTQIYESIINCSDYTRGLSELYKIIKLKLS